MMSIFLSPSVRIKFTNQRKNCKSNVELKEVLLKERIREYWNNSRDIFILYLLLLQALSCFSLIFLIFKTPTFYYDIFSNIHKSEWNSVITCYYSWLSFSNYQYIANLVSSTASPIYLLLFIRFYCFIKVKLM